MLVNFWPRYLGIEYFLFKVLKIVGIASAMNDEENTDSTITVNFYAEDGTALTEAPIILPLNTTTDQLQDLCNQLLNNDDDTKLPIQFRTEEGAEIAETLGKSISEDALGDEKVCI